MSVLGLMNARPELSRIGVVVPVHNEADLLPACLRSVGTASDRLARTVPLPVDLVVVLDGCTDRSGEIVADFAAGATQRVQVVTTDARSVGAARRAGMAALLERGPESGLWLATTDADSRVPADWLVRHQAHHAGGADAVLGTVAVEDWSDHAPAIRTMHAGRYRATHGHRHVHGANIGLTASAYLAAGGFPAVAAHEDVLLVRALQDCQAHLVWADDVPVVTSARRVGRAPLGFAGYLHDLGLEHSERLEARIGSSDTAHPEAADVVLG